MNQAAPVVVVAVVVADVFKFRIADTVVAAAEALAASFVLKLLSLLWRLLQPNQEV